MKNITIKTSQVQNCTNGDLKKLNEIAATAEQMNLIGSARVNGAYSYVLEKTRVNFPNLNIINDGDIWPTYVPFAQDSYTKDELIEEYGDLFETFRNAPEAPFGTNTKSIYGQAAALKKDVESITIGNQLSVRCIVYEDGVEIGRYTSQATITFSSSTSTKHIVGYTSSVTGGTLHGLVGYAITNGYYTASTDHNGVKNLYYNLDNGYKGKYYLNGFLNNMAKDKNAILFVPYITTQCTSLGRFQGKAIVIRNEETELNNDLYLFGMCNNLYDVYVPYTIGKVPSITSATSFAHRNIALHIPNLGNALDNETLMAEYIEKGWTTGKFSKGIFHDFEETVPEFKIE